MIFLTNTVSSHISLSVCHKWSLCSVLYMQFLALSKLATMSLR